MPGAPENLEIFQRGAGREIVRRWFNDRTIGFSVFAVIVNGMAFFLYVKMSSHWALAEGLSPLHFALYGLPSAAVFMAYWATAEWMNRTWIVVDPEYVSVRHGPLPWPGNRKLAAAQIRRLHTRTSPWVSGKGQYRRYTYDVLADMQDGKTLKLAGGFADVDQAVRVKQEIDRHLGLKPEQTQTKPAATPGSGTGETNIQSVLAIWLFILLWNGVVWGLALMLWDSPSLKNAGVALAFFAVFALIGFGLICLMIPSTWRFFRQKSTARPGTAARKSSWTAVICMLVIAGGFILILMQASKAPDRTPFTEKQLLEAHESNKARLIREYRTQMGEPQPVTFFEGTWRRHGRLSQDDVRRVNIRSNGGDLSIRVWYDCIYRGPACDAGEVPAVLTARPDGLIESLSAKLPVPKSRIWLWMSSGKYSYQPAVIGTGFAGTVGILVRENPAAPLAEYVGEWGRPAPKEIGAFTRLTVRQTGTQSLAIQVWALCDDRRECDLGEKTAQMELEADGLLREAKVVFETKYGELTIILEPPYQGRFDAHGILHKESKSTSTTSTVRVALTRGHPH